MYIHPSRGESCHWATHPLILRLFLWSNKNSCLGSALKINSSIGTGGLCTTWTQRRKQTTGQHTARPDQGSSVGKPLSVFLHVGTSLWTKTESFSLQTLCISISVSTVLCQTDLYHRSGPAALLSPRTSDTTSQSGPLPPLEPPLSGTPWWETREAQLRSLRLSTGTCTASPSLVDLSPPSGWTF